MRTDKATDHRGIATVMITTLRCNTCLTMNSLFNNQRNNINDAPESWIHASSIGLPKDKNGALLEQLRWIVKASITRQWYQRCNRDKLRIEPRTRSTVRTY